MLLSTPRVTPVTTKPKRRPFPVEIIFEFAYHGLDAVVYIMVGLCHGIICWSKGATCRYYNPGSVWLLVQSVRRILQLVSFQLWYVVAQNCYWKAMWFQHVGHLSLAASIRTSRAVKRAGVGSGTSLLSQSVCWVLTLICTVWLVCICREEMISSLAIWLVVCTASLYVPLVAVLILFPELLHKKKCLGFPVRLTAHRGGMTFKSSQPYRYFREPLKVQIPEYKYEFFQYFGLAYWVWVSNL